MKYILFNLPRGMTIWTEGDTLSDALDKFVFYFGMSFDDDIHGDVTWAVNASQDKVITTYNGISELWHLSEWG